jgi:predicted nucleic acid-binding protein
MDERVVIDASIALAYLGKEVATSSVENTMASWMATGVELVVPSHFWIEITNVLVRRRATSPNDAIEQLLALDDLELTTIDLDRPTLLAALVEMDRAGLSAYDAVYLALAQSLDAQLATLDHRLAEAAGERGLLIGDSRRASEPRARYAVNRIGDRRWLPSARVGAYIAELRRQAGERSMLVGDGGQPA